SIALRKVADDLDKIDGAVTASYKGRFIGTDEELEDLVNEESWLKADECISLGFCDGILEESDEGEETKDEEDEENIKDRLLNKYRGTQKLAAKATEESKNDDLMQKLLKIYTD
uniref:hypothetical protein n=1 Tax=Anaerosalibacter massiliensis TaxID=1347392 RepID=UPI0005B2CF21